MIFQSLDTWTRRLLTMLRSSRGGRHLLDSNQFEYRVTKKKPNKTYYQCIQRKNNSCPAGAVVNNKNDKIISFLGSCEDKSTWNRKTSSLKYLGSTTAGCKDIWIKLNDLVEFIVWHFLKQWSIQNLPSLTLFLINVPVRRLY